MRRVATAAVLLPLVVLAVRFFPSSLFLLFLDVVIILSLVELFRLLAVHDVRGYGVTYPVALLLPWIWSYPSAWLVRILVLIVLVFMGKSVLQTRHTKSGFLSASANLLAIAYLSVPLSIAGNLQKEGRWKELLLILTVIWAGDMAAYWVGRKWGKHKVTPKISPHKSLEGFVAGLGGSIFAALFFGFYLLPSLTMSYLVLTGVVLAAAGMVGDLFESMIKRSADLKDSSNLLPGHGGILDRLDSLFFALPAYYCLLIW
ncbi:MAG: phosphatidate cytidylyltransferase [Acidobacteriota bacterium]